MTADGREEVDLTASAHDEQPAWSADGQHLLFISNRTGSRDFWALPMRDGKVAGAPAMVRRDTGQIESMGITAANVLHYEVPLHRSRSEKSSLSRSTPWARCPQPFGRRSVSSAITPRGHTDGNAPRILSEQSYVGGDRVPIRLSARCKRGPRRTTPAPAPSFDKGRFYGCAMAAGSFRSSHRLQRATNDSGTKWSGIRLPSAPQPRCRRTAAEWRLFPQTTRPCTNHPRFGSGSVQPNRGGGSRQ